MTDTPNDVRPHHDHSRLERFLLGALFAILVYTLLAYLVLPAFWTHHEHQKDLTTLSMVT